MWNFEVISCECNVEKFYKEAVISFKKQINVDDGGDYDEEWWQ
jgi:hypothetical protein